MDTVRNPFVPGAGTPPPELAGQDEVLESARGMPERTRLGRPVKILALIGRRGVGKTVLLDAIREQAETRNLHALDLEAAENHSLPSVSPRLHMDMDLWRLSCRKAAAEAEQRVLKCLAGFVRGLKDTFQDMEVSIGYEAEPALATGPRRLFSAGSRL